MIFGGGFHVRDVPQEVVLDAIERYWLSKGARILETAAPLHLSKESLEKRGQLGYQVFEEMPWQEHGGKWVAVRDSTEIYCDRDLGEWLARQLHTYVFLYLFTERDAEFHGYGTGAGRIPTPKEQSREAIEDFVMGLPLGRLRYSSFAPEPPPYPHQTLSFEEIPYRGGSPYSGPSPHQKQREKRRKQLTAQALVALRQGDAVGVKDLEAEEAGEILREAIGALRHPRDDGVGFLTASGFLLREGSFLSSLALAAALAHEEALLQQAVEGMGDYYWAERHAYQMLQRKEYDAALLYYSALCRVDASLPNWNNLCHAAIFSSLPVDPALFVGAEERSYKNPSIPHNLACAYAQRGQLDDAIRAVELAVDVGYKQLEQMKSDEDLEPLFDDPRFHAAFERKPKLAPEALVLYEGSEQKYIAARVLLGMELTFAFGAMEQLAPQVAELLEHWLTGMPSPMPSHHRTAEGRWEVLDHEQLDGDLESLRRGIALDLDYRSSPYGEPGEGDIELCLSEERRWLRVFLPIAGLCRPREVEQQFREAAALVPVAEGRAGYMAALRKDESSNGKALADAHLHRHYPGLEAHWLSFFEDQVLLRSSIPSLF